MMQDLVDFLRNMFFSIGSFVWGAIVRFYNFVSEELNQGLLWLMAKLVEILPESAQNLPAAMSDFLGLANYYFPLSEMFTLIAIYIQFRIALLLVRGTIKLMTAGQV